MRRYGPEARELPAAGGAYVLVLRAAGEPFRARIGALGAIEFRPGFYCYVGSARAGLRARVTRHLRRVKARRWHMDYLRERTRPAAVYACSGKEADQCRLNAAVAALADGSVRGFGSSDCRCPGHLHYFRSDPSPLLDGLEPGG